MRNWREGWCRVPALFLLFFWVTGAARAVPVWRTVPPGQAPTTYQQWMFDDADNPAVPEISYNTYCTASAQITLGGATHGRQPGWYNSWWGRQGVWVSNETTVTLTIPDSPIANTYKEVWVEMVFWGELLPDTGITNPAHGVTKLAETLEYTTDAWRIWNVGWRIEPNPAEETIFIHMLNSGAIVDYITVDTLCVPEPTTICLLGLGGLALLYRKRQDIRLAA